MWIKNILCIFPLFVSTFSNPPFNHDLRAAVRFQCSFQKDVVTFHEDFQYVEFYECFLKTPFFITTKNSMVDLVYREATSHKYGITDANVTELFISRKKLHYIPTNFGQFFQNLRYLAVWDSELAEINQSDMKQFPNLEFLCLRFNNFDYLSEDLFKFNPKLEFIRLFGNKIKEIHTTAFNGLTNLRTLNLERNVCVDKKFVNSVENVKVFVQNLPSLCQFSNEIANFTESLE